MKIGFICVSDNDQKYKESVEEEQDEDVRDATAAAAADDDDDDSEYFEDVVASVPSLAELQQQVVGMIGESLFNCVFNVVQVQLCLIGCLYTLTVMFCVGLIIE